MNRFDVFLTKVTNIVVNYLNRYSIKINDSDLKLMKFPSKEDIDKISAKELTQIFNNYIEELSTTNSSRKELLLYIADAVVKWRKDFSSQKSEQETQDIVKEICEFNGNLKALLERIYSEQLPLRSLSGNEYNVSGLCPSLWSYYNNANECVNEYFSEISNIAENNNEVAKMITDHFQTEEVDDAPAPLKENVSDQIVQITEPPLPNNQPDKPLVSEIGTFKPGSPSSSQGIKKEEKSELQLSAEIPSTDTTKQPEPFVMTTFRPFSYWMEDSILEPSPETQGKEGDKDNREKLDLDGGSYMTMK